MPRDGNGTYVRTDGSREGGAVFDEQRQEVPDGRILAPLMDRHAQDMADAITGSVARDGQGGMTGDLNMGTNKVTRMADATARSDAATLGQLLDLITPFLGATLVGGTANAITLTPTQALTQHVIGRGFRFMLKAAPTGSLTVAISGEDPVEVRLASGGSFVEGAAANGRYVTIIYNGAVYLSDVPPPISIPEAQADHEHGYLDIHEHLTTEMTAPSASDRLAVSDESVAGDPPKWLSLSGFRTWLATTITLAATRITSGKFNLAQIPSIDESRIPSTITRDSELNARISAAQVLRIPSATPDTDGTFYGRVGGVTGYFNPFPSGLRDNQGRVPLRDNVLYTAVYLTTAKSKLRIEIELSTNTSLRVRYAVIPASGVGASVSLVPARTTSYDHTTGSLTPGLCIVEIAVTEERVTSTRVRAIA